MLVDPVGMLIIISTFTAIGFLAGHYCGRRDERDTQRAERSSEGDA